MVKHRQASSISEHHINMLYPEDWKHNPDDWKAKGIVFEEDPDAGEQLDVMVNARAHCKIILT